MSFYVIIRQSKQRIFSLQCGSDYVILAERRGLEHCLIAVCIGHGKLIELCREQICIHTLVHTVIRIVYVVLCRRTVMEQCAAEIEIGIEYTPQFLIHIDWLSDEERAIVVDD